MLVYIGPSGKSKAVIKSVARENGKGAFYKVVDFAGREEVMNVYRMRRSSGRMHKRSPRWQGEKPVAGRGASNRARKMKYGQPK
jgi:hypothetical protein